MRKINFAQARFWGIGAYVTAILTRTAFLSGWRCPPPLRRPDCAACCGRADAAPARLLLAMATIDSVKSSTGAGALGASLAALGTARRAVRVDRRLRP